MTALPFLTGSELAERATGLDVVGFLEQALQAGIVDPESDSPRLFSPAPDGEFLMMPTAGEQWSGFKLVTIAPANPARGKPKIQGTYTLFRSEDLAPVALMDGVELTLMRTAATTVLAIKHLLAAAVAGGRGDALPTMSAQRLDPLKVVIFGTGPQAARHLRYLAEVVGPVDAVVVGRQPDSAATFVESFDAAQVDVRAGTAQDVRVADVVLCVTSSSTPVVDDRLVRDDAVVAAVGSHGVDKAELPAALIRRADIAVEGRASAMRESGNLLQARNGAEWRGLPVANLRDLVAGDFVRRPGHPAVFSGVGMAWEDLVVATALWESCDPSASRSSQ